MENRSKFCNCDNFACPLHPTKHDNGCAPCIHKNLKLKEIPNCFFSLVNGSKDRSGDSFEFFASLVMKQKA